jgi:H+/Cl- antiporter ClcA
VPAAAAPPSAAADPAEILRSRGFVVVLVLAAVVGIVVSFVGWRFLELVHWLQTWVFLDLPHGVGLDPVPSWWALPICTLAGLPVAFAIARLPGKGGHVPAEGLQVGPTEPKTVPGVALAGLASLGLGLVLGPEAPLIAIGSGVAVYVVRVAKRDAPPTLLLVLGAAGAFAAISTIFGSPIIAAVLVIEASGLGGATLPLVLIPGLIAAGIGSLVFVGMADWTGLNTAAYSLPPLHLTSLGTPTVGEIGWAILLGIAAAIVTYPIRKLGLGTARLVPKKILVVVPLSGLVVAALALTFAQVTDKSANTVLFSGQEALGPLVAHAGAYSVATLLALVVFKGLAWSISLGSFRGGPAFPALFIGAAGGIAASHLPGLPTSAAIPVGIGAMFVAYLRLPLSAVIIASVLCASAGAGGSPLVIVGVVVAYLATLGLERRLGPSTTAEHDEADSPPAAAPPQ